MMVFVMVGVGVQVGSSCSKAEGTMILIMLLQLRALTKTYEALVKDRAIIASEVMHEYDEKVSALVESWLPED